jgi:tRNA1Val (adenine37-N6)-methyltransferase
LAAQTTRENLSQNGLTGTIVTGDLRQPLLPAGQFELVVSNPPYFPLNSGKSGGPARSEETCTLDQLCAAASRLVKNGGRFALCHRPERLADVICTLRAHDLEPKRLKLLRHGPDHPPSLLLVEALRQGKPGMKIEFS